ncbi:MAG: hypothetical protein KGM46_11060 [Pseudomonadota bacterium]|jgi:hypothetical protein|nr:hypothetical protein [Xanthomonadaceae bacterium]MDE2248103.1 hypothetical protein [Xanthomonadaceae bacterium]MDE3211270.1 hypothetical protein [Pseudomonadota bacterium]
MKLQLDHQQLRVRIDEAELARLLAGTPVAACTRFAGAFALQCVLSLGSAAAALTGQPDAWQIRLPGDAVRELAGRLPSREGLRFELGAVAPSDTLTLLFDVDVRDSARRMKATRER